MFSAIVISPDSRASELIEYLCAGMGQISLDKIINRPIHAHELVRLLHVSHADLLFLDLSDWDSGIRLARETRDKSPGTAMLAFGVDLQVETEVLFAQTGIAGLLTTPLNQRDFDRAVDHAIHRVRGDVQQKLIAFLPSKAGGGCTTVALNSAGRLAADQCRKVLMIEGDLHSGILSILLDCAPARFVQDALLNPGQLDNFVWPEFVVHDAGVDFMLTNRSKKGPLPTWAAYHELLRFALPLYDTVFVDLPEVVNDATVEIVRLARSVFVVCTPELPSLKLAGQRSEELQSRGIPADRVSILVNRYHNSDMPIADIERLLGHPVFAVFPNSYPVVHRATMSSQLVDPSTSLGKSFAAFARKVAGVPDEAVTGFRGLGMLKRLVKA